MGDIFLGSFDVAGVDIVFEVCVFDAYWSSETMLQGRKLMTQNKKRKLSIRAFDCNLHLMWLHDQ